MVNEFKLTVVHFARPNPMQSCVCAWIYRWTKKLENQDWATGPPGRRAAGPPGRRAAGPSRAVGRGPMGLWAAGPLGRLGPWAVGRGPLGRGPAFSKTRENWCARRLEWVAHAQRLRFWILRVFYQWTWSIPSNNEMWNDPVIMYTPYKTKQSSRYETRAGASFLM